MTHRLNLFLLVIGLLFLVPFYWLLLQNPPRRVPPQRIDVAELRRLADQIPGPKPVEIEAAHLGWKRVPGNFYAAGSGMKRRSFAILAFRLAVPGGGSVVIDTGTTARAAAAMELEAFLPQSQAVVDRWMDSAGLILVTSERPQHLAGLAAWASHTTNARVLDRVRLNPAQIPHDAAARALGWPASRYPGPVLSGRSAHAVAPGVVVIPTGVPSPGSQMIFARLADGREYLFAGDIAPLGPNYASLRVRSNLLDRHVPARQRSETMRWLLGLRDLHHQAPQLKVVPGHDFDWIVDPQQNLGIIPAEQLHRRMLPLENRG